MLIADLLSLHLVTLKFFFIVVLLANIEAPESLRIRQYTLSTVLLSFHVPNYIRCSIRIVTILTVLRLSMAQCVCV